MRLGSITLFRNKFFLVLFLLSCYMVIFRIPLPGTDDIFYKQAGLNLARGFGFASPALQGFLPGVEKVFSLYPPVYPFLFGICFFILGFSITSSLMVSFLICGLSAAIQVALYKTLLNNKRIPLHIYFLIFFSWTLSIKAIDRPDPFLVLLVLTLLLLIIKKLPAGSSNKTQVCIIALMGLSLSTSPVLGALLILYIFSVVLSIKGCNAVTVIRFGLWFSLAVVLMAIIWCIPVARDPGLFQDQFLIRFTTNNNIPFLLWSLQGCLKFNFKYGFTGFYIPLFVFLLAIFIVNILLEKDRYKIKFLGWQFLALCFIIFLELIEIPRKYTYQQATFPFLVLVCGIAMIYLLGRIKWPFLRKTVLICFFVTFIIASLPFLRMLIFPLSWNRQDLYDYNSELILSNIPKGSLVLTDPGFWYVFNENYRIFDANFGFRNILNYDYVLLASGGRINAATHLPFRNKYKDYFYKNFKVKLSTLSSTPNEIFGFAIARSRWCYRFILYERIK